jgi:UDP-glucuronate decarboxylase
MSRVLVTGGAGFIGSHLCEFLLNNGDEVVAVDNFYTGTKKNIAHLIHNPSFELIMHDMINPLYVEVDQIYNLACPASPIHYQKNPIRTLKMGTVAMINVLGLARRTNARILQASTSEVYGNPLVHPQSEGYWGNVNPVGPRSCYDEGKRVAESFMMAYHQHEDVDICIARIFNTYGPKMSINDGRVVSNFIVQALRDQPLTIYGKGDQTRSFCYISDLVQGLHSLMNTKDFIGPVNIGNPNECTVLELALLIKTMVGSNSEIVFKPLPGDDPTRRKPDITLARKVLGWEPSMQLSEGLGKTISYFRDEISNRKGC